MKKVMLLLVSLMIALVCEYTSASEKPEIFVQMGHSGGVNSVAFSPDGKYILSGSADKTLKLWDVVTGRKIKTFKGHTDEISSVAFSPDGRFALSGSYDGTPILWDILTGSKKKTFIFNSKDIVPRLSLDEVKEMLGVLGILDAIDLKILQPEIPYTLSFNEDGSISINNAIVDKEIERITFEHIKKSFIKIDKTVANKLTPKDIQELGKLEGKMDIRSVAFSRDGSLIAAGAGKIIVIWNVVTGERVKMFEGNNTRAGCIALSPNGSYLTAGYENGEIYLFDIKSGGKTKKFSFSGWINFLSFSPDGKQIIAGNTKKMKLLNVLSGEEIAGFGSPTDTFSSAAFSPDGKFIISSSAEYADGKYKFSLWDVSTGKEIKSLFSDHKITTIAFSPDGNDILGGGPNTLELWNINSGQMVRTFSGNSDKVYSLIFSTDGKKLFSSQQGKVVFWDIVSGKAQKTLSDFPRTVPTPVISKNGRYVLSLAGDGSAIDVWNIASGEIISSFKGLERSSYYAFISEFLVVSLGQDDKFYYVRVFDVLTGKEKKRFKIAPQNLGICWAFSDKFVLIGGYDGSLKLWDLLTGKPVWTLKDDSGASIISVAISPDNKHVLSNFDLREISAGKKKISFKLGDDYHVDFSFKAIFSRDGKYALLKIGDLALLFDIKTGEKLRSFNHTAINEINFSADSKHIVSASTDGSIKYWDASTNKEIAQFITFTDGEWIVITPEGYFNASPNGAKHLNVRVGNNVYSIENFYEKFFNPVYVASVLQGKKVEAVADIRKGIMTPPDVKIISPEPNKEFSTDTISITVSAKDTGGGIDEIRLYHNGKAIGEDQRAVKIIPKGNETTKTYTVTLVDGLNNFRAVGFSKDRTESNPYELIVKLTAPQKDVSLYILAVGINKYKNPALNLNYAEPDARGIVDFFKQKGKGLFKKVEIIEIYNEQATKETIISKLKQLEKTNPQDVVLIYLASHGENVNDKWYLIPHELTYPEREEDVKTKGISSDELAGYIKSIKAQKILMLIDACKSGAVLIAFRGFEDRKALSQLSRSTGVHIIAASTKDQFAAEVKDLGHGVFTYILLEGLKGKAAGKGEPVTVRKLMGYVEEKLPEITKKYKQEAQYPVVDSRGMDFPLVIAK